MRTLTALPTSLLALLTLTLAADLQIETTKPASCTRPTRPGDSISVHYRGTLQSDGTEFDSSYTRNDPISFTLGAGHVIAGWDEGHKDMCPGEGRRLTIPSEMAYGAFGSPPVIPGGATLVFETVLVGIKGVDAGVVSVVGSSLSEGVTLVTGTAATTEAGGFTIQTAPSRPTTAFEEKVEHKTVAAAPTPALEATRLHPSPTSTPDENPAGECHLLGPFALIVQAALGVVALLSLVVKRLRESPKRPWKIWFFDVSKQLVGSVLVHILNLVMSMLGAGDIEHASESAVIKTDKEGTTADSAASGGKSSPNPCSFYLLNLLIDTTIGIAILYTLLKLLHAAFAHTPLARPPASIKSGHYGQPPNGPHATWWLKQSLIYFLGLFGMKLCVLVLFLLLPWLPWVGDWMLRWTEGNEALEIAFVMFIFPVLMNGVQYWVIDNFIMDKGRGGQKDGEGGEYERVGGGLDGTDSDDEVTAVDVETERGKLLGGRHEEGLGREAVGSNNGSRRTSPLGKDRND